MIIFSRHYPEPSFYIEYEYLERLAKERNLESLMIIYNQAIHHIRENKILNFYKNGRFEIYTKDESYLPKYFGRLPITLTEKDFPLKKIWILLKGITSMFERIKLIRNNIAETNCNEKVSCQSDEMFFYSVETPLERITLVISIAPRGSLDYKNYWTLSGEALGINIAVSKDDFGSMQKYFRDIKQ